MYVTRHVTEIRMLLDMLRGYVRDLINKWTHTLLDVLQGHVRLLNVLRGYVRYLICYRDMYVTSYVTGTRMLLEMLQGHMLLLIRYRDKQFVHFLGQFKTNNNNDDF